MNRMEVESLLRRSSTINYNHRAIQFLRENPPPAMVALDFCRVFKNNVHAKGMMENWLDNIVGELSTIVEHVHELIESNHFIVPHALENFSCMLEMCPDSAFLFFDDFLFSLVHSLPKHKSTHLFLKSLQKQRDLTELFAIGPPELRLEEKQETKQSYLTTKLNVTYLDDYESDCEPSEDEEDIFSPFEQELLSVYMTNPTVFERKNKKTQERSELKKKTGLSDEQLEGWYSMLKRGKRRLPILKIEQNVIPRTKWRKEK